MIQYYTRSFLYFHKEIAGKVHNGTVHLRQNFWKLVPEREYSYIDGKPLFESYFQSLESRIKSIVENYSAAYWLHVSRRILPNSPGDDKTPATIATVRSILNAAIQKYGQANFCKHVGKSKEVDVSEVFNGLLVGQEFEFERRMLELSVNQLILTDFNHFNLIEYYELEKLCYEVWYCEAKMRALQKGAIMEVDLRYDDLIKEYRTEELARLIESYDSRHSDFFSSATGTVFTNVNLDRESEISIPILNVGHIKVDQLNEMFEKLYGFTVGKDYISNFIVLPIPVKKFIHAHLPFEKDFKLKNGVSFKTVVFVITTLCFRYFFLSIKKEFPAIVTIMQRGYEGPQKRSEIIDTIMYYSGYAKKILGFDFDYSQRDIKKAVEYLTLKDKESVHLMYPGTLKMFLPVGENRLYIDYSLIIDMLNNLFYGINLNAYNFRGDTLETALNQVKSYLPTKPCKNLEGKEKQIDFSLRIGALLIIGECKVVAMSLGYYTGEYNALKHRNEKVIEKGLSQVDEKALWLAKYPVGRNYDLEGIDYILPITISPFKEYIPSLNRFYWITNELPRILSLSEVQEFLDAPISINDIYNLVPIVRAGK